MPPFRTTRRVEFRDTDAAGIAHFSAFVFYMESVEHELLRHLGLSVFEKDENGDGVLTWPRVSVHCDYARAVRFEDVLDVAVKIGRLGTKSVSYEFEFTSAGRPVAEGRMVAVCCRVIRGQPPQSLAIPDSVAAKLRAFV